MESEIKYIEYKQNAPRDYFNEKVNDMITKILKKCSYFDEQQHKFCPDSDEQHEFINYILKIAQQKKDEEDKIREKHKQEYERYKRLFERRLQFTTYLEWAERENKIGTNQYLFKNVMFDKWNCTLEEKLFISYLLQFKHGVPFNLNKQ